MPSSWAEMQRVARFLGILVFLGLLPQSAIAGKARHLSCPSISWKNPPPSNRMTAWWTWYGTAITKKEVLRELTAMHAAGLGGVLIYPEYPLHLNDPALGIKNLRYLSVPYLEVYDYAVEAARHLGMTVDVTGASGWPYGGPSVSVHAASHAIRMEKHTVEGKGLTRVATLGPDEKLLAAFMVEPSSEEPRFRDITRFVSPAGELRLRMNTGTEVLSIVATPTRMEVKRPSRGGEGYVLDHLSSEALKDYTSHVLDKLVSGLPSGSLRAVFVDSLEAYGSDWTWAFQKEFERGRGYDLRPLYPYLFEDLGPRTQDVRYDFWETVADLFVAGFVRPLHEWSREHGIQLEMQAYGVPAVPQRAYADVDLPSGEQYDWKNFTEGRWASSAAHFYGKKRVLAEYATWAGIPNRFTDTLDDLKLVADLQFLTGLTELGAATLPYSPPSVGIPGWADYAGADFGLNQTWWPFFPNLTAYVHRVSYVLEQGRPMSDVLLYLPVEDVEANASPGSLHTVFRVRDRLAQATNAIPEFGLKNALRYQTPLISAILDSGYSFDGISGGILAERGFVRGRRLDIGDGSYAVVVLPRITGMRLNAIEKIAAFVREGGFAIAVGQLPRRVYGGREPDKETARLQILVRQMFGSKPKGLFNEHADGLGRGIYVADEREVPRALHRVCPPDLSLENANPQIGFVHRRARLSTGEDADYYFIVNTGKEERRLQASFRVENRQPQVWDLEQGSAVNPAGYSFQGKRTVVKLDLLPHRSAVVYFGASHMPSPVAASNISMLAIVGNAMSGVVSHPGQYYVQTSSGRLERTVSSMPEPISIKGPWKVEFGPPMKTSLVIKKLESWTQEPATRHFSGIGKYTTGIQIPQPLLGPRSVVLLDLGDVRNAARVWVNGHLAGDAWQAPFRLEIDRWLRPGRNTLKVAVANLLINTVLGQRPPNYKSLIAVYGERFPYPEDWKVNPGPRASGLLGPVRLVFKTRVGFRSNL